MRRLLSCLICALLIAPAYAGWGGAPSHTPPWVDKAEAGGVVYFLYQFPFKLERYELSSRSWLPTIEFDAAPRDIAMLPQGFVVAFGSKVSRFALDGSGEQLIPNAWTNSSDIVADDGFLFVFKDRQIQSIRLSDGVQVDVYTSFGGYDTPSEVVSSPEANLFFGWDVGLSPSDILRIGYDPNTGMIDDNALSSPYHGDFPRGGRLFARADGQVLLDRAGVAYRGTDLSYRGGLGGYVRDAVFGSQHVLLARDDDAVLLDPSFRELGVANSLEPVHGVALSGNTVYLFGGGDGRSVQVLAVSSFRAPVAVAPASPHSRYEPNKVEMSDSGRLFMFDRLRSTVHRFDLAAGRYLPSVGLLPTTDFVSLDALGERLYVAQTGGRISLVPRDSASENFLAHSPPDLINLAAMDGLVMAADLTGAWESHRVFNGVSGVETDWVDWNYGASQFTWDRASRRVYFFRDGTSPNDLHFEQVSVAGRIVADGESPYHGEVGTRYPIRLPPSGSYVLLGSGEIYDASGLGRLGQLNETLTDAAWIGSTLYTLKPSAASGRSELTRWSSFTPASRATIPGLPIALFSWQGQIVATTRVDGFVRVFRYPASLTGLNFSTTLFASQVSAAAGAPLSWRGDVTNEGMGSATAMVTLTFSDAPAGLSVNCAVDGVPLSCEPGAPFAVALEAGAQLTVEAFGAMHAMEAPLIARLSAAIQDNRLEDNEAEAGVLLDTGIFENGFE